MWTDGCPSSFATPYSSHHLVLDLRVSMPYDAAAPASIHTSAILFTYIIIIYV
jgi:hypothetical protein